MPAERDVQDYIGKRLKELGWDVVLWGKGVKGERESLEETILQDRFFRMIERINDIRLSEEDQKEILSRIFVLPNSIEGIRNFLDFVKNGIAITMRRDRAERERLVRLIDFDNPENNDFFVVKEFEVRENERTRRLDLCLFVNGIPIVDVETKNPFGKEEQGTTWYDAYTQIVEYEDAIPSLYKCVQFCVASDGHETKHFPNFYGKDYNQYVDGEKGVWKSYYPVTAKEVKPLKLFPYLDSTIFGVLSKRNLLDLIENFTFIKKVKDRYVKILAWYTQFEAANRIVRRVVEEQEKKLGLIWHWQGSGKTLTMAFAAWKLLRNPRLEVPTIFVIVDRRELQRQIVEEEFAPIGIEIEKIANTGELAKILQWGGKQREGKRGIFISLIQKFSPEKLKKLHDEGEINLARENIVIFTDESHRSQYGVLANVMRGVFKNARIFGFTGTPLTKPERNTFQKFSPKGELYLHRFGMLDSIDNGFTIPIRYDARLPELHLKEQEITDLADYEEEVIEELMPKERALWRRKVKPRLAVLKSPERIQKISKDIGEYFLAKVSKTQLKAMLATVDRESCVLFKRELDRLLEEDRLTEVVMTYQTREKSGAIAEYKKELVKRYGHSDFDKINREIVDKYRDEDFPKILIVSDMLLTGFDAKRLWTLFLYKPLREHRLLQAVARTNRPFQGLKEFGLVVDYVGVAKNLERALQQFEADFVKEAKLIIRDLGSSEREFERLIIELKKMLRGVAIKDIDDMDEAVALLVKNGGEKEFEEKTRRLRNLYELLSPSDVTFEHLEFYKWVICVSVALHRHRQTGMRLGEIEKMARKTYELIQNTVGVERIEKIGEVELVKELVKLESGRKPVSAIRVLGEIERRGSGRRSDFYVSLTKEVEQIVDEMRVEKEVTKKVIDRIKSVYGKLERREAEGEKFGELFPVFDVLRDYFPGSTKTLDVSKEVLENLKKRDLLSKDSFLKGSLRKEIRRTVREALIQNFGLVEQIDDIEGKILMNLESEYA
jgi:type I restriction enzyme R subunit